MTDDALDCLAPESVALPPTRSGPLDGRTFVAKDLFGIAGHRASFGIARWRETHDASTRTASAVARLLDAGAALVGTAKLDSLAYSLVGNAGEGRAPRNPLHPERFTGGSSSGPAAAVAGGLADLGLGSDTAGSIRIPAAACGLWSLRPTHGRVDADGMLPLAPSFDTVGVLGADPWLLRAACAVLVGDRSPTSTATEVLVAADALDWVDPEVADAVARAASTVAARLGCPSRTADLRGFTSVDAADLLARMQGRELWARHGTWVEPNLDVFIPEVRRRLERARDVAADHATIAAADAAQRSALRDAFGRLVGPGTCVVIPVLHDLPPRRDASDDDLVEFRSACFRLTAPASLVGAPEVVVPVLHRRSGHTYGVGLLGAPGSDHVLLDAAVRAGANGRLSV